MKRRLWLLLLGIALGARGEPLGRLFFTPDERRQLEQPAAATTPSAPQRLDGIVVGSTGLRLHWVDGQLASGKSDGLAVGDSLLQPLLPPGSLRLGSSAGEEK